MTCAPRVLSRTRARPPVVIPDGAPGATSPWSPGGPPPNGDGTAPRAAPTTWKMSPGGPARTARLPPASAGGSHPANPSPRRRPRPRGRPRPRPSGGGSPGRGRATTPPTLRSRTWSPPWRSTRPGLRARRLGPGRRRRPNRGVRTPTRPRARPRPVPRHEAVAHRLLGSRPRARRPTPHSHVRLRCSCPTSKKSAWLGAPRGVGGNGSSPAKREPATREDARPTPATHWHGSSAATGTTWPSAKPAALLPSQGYPHLCRDPGACYRSTRS